MCCRAPPGSTEGVGSGTIALDSCACRWHRRVTALKTSLSPSLSSCHPLRGHWEWAHFGMLEFGGPLSSSSCPLGLGGRPRGRGCEPRGPPGQMLCGTRRIPRGRALAWQAGQAAAPEPGQQKSRRSESRPTQPVTAQDGPGPGLPAHLFPTRNLTRRCFWTPPGQTPTLSPSSAQPNESLAQTQTPAETSPSAV